MEENTTVRIDLVKAFRYLLRNIWLPILLAALFGGWIYYGTVYQLPDSYTASGTFYVYNSNPNMVNYQYATSIDLDSAVQLIDTYMIVVRSNKVMEVVLDRMVKDYPGITSGFISSSLSMDSVSETGVVKVSSTTVDPKLSTDIVNAVLDVAPQEIIRVVGAGNIEIIDYAVRPVAPDYRHTIRRTSVGVIAGAILGCILLLLRFLMNRKITNTDDLSAYYSVPVLASIRRKRNYRNRKELLLTRESPMELLESYSKLRMNLMYTLVGKNSHSVVITSAISGEGKSTIAVNLAISCGMGGKKVLLVDSDLRRSCQKDNFEYDLDHKGLSEVLVGECEWKDAVIPDVQECLDLLPAGQLPPNPGELLASDEMKCLIPELEKEYDIVLFDMPPVNIVSDPLAVSNDVAGCLFVACQNYSDRRDIRSAMTAINMTDMTVLGFVFYGDKIDQGNYYRRRYYSKYYNRYDNRTKMVNNGKKDKG